MKNILLNIYGGAKVFDLTNRRHWSLIPGFALVLMILSSSVAFGQGSIFGSVTNSDLSVPANGEISFFGYLDDTDEEIRIETCVGAGYDAGNWFDDFQNYLTEAPGNPYDYHFHNSFNGEGFVLSELIPNNSFQQEDILLTVISWPSSPTGLGGKTISSTAVVISWNVTPGLTYHVYRRLNSSSGSFFRIDDPTGSLANPGVSDSFYVDTTVDGISDYDYLVIAEDISGNLSPHSAILTVSSATTEAPLIVDITPDTGLTLGGTPVTISGSGFDPGGASATIGGSNVTSLVVVSPFEITGLSPAGSPGPADVVVINAASGMSSAPLVGGFVYKTNSVPVLAAIGSQLVIEGDPLTFPVSATDADLDSLILTTENVPTNATFTDNYDGTGTFNFNPDFTQSGIYDVLFIASDGSEADSESVQITVTEAGNQTPVLATIGSQLVIEGDPLTFPVSATDADLDSLILTAENVPTNATFTDNYDGTGTFNFNPDFTQAGIYDVLFIASDGVDADSESVQITVTEAGNHAPVLATIGSQLVVEGDPLTFPVSATDADLDSLILTAENVPTNATFTDNYDGTGTFNFNPDFTQSGIYDVLFIASDGVDADSESVQITVTETGNQTPVLATIGSQLVIEGDPLTFPVSATDADGDSLILTAENVPTNATFTDNYDGTGTFNFNPDFTQAGIYDVLIIASDGTDADSESVQITVTEAGNHAPELDSIGQQVVQEGSSLNLLLTSTDIDGDSLIYTAENVPGNAILTDNFDNTAAFDFNPDLTQTGVYDVTFIVSDGVLADSEIVQIVVTETGNQSPAFDSIPEQVIPEGDTLVILVHAVDPEGDIPQIIVSTEIESYTFVDSGNGYATFEYAPDYFSAGVDSVRFIAIDQNVPPFLGIADVQITVVDVNQPPIIDTLPMIYAEFDDSVNLRITATDPTDPDSIPTLSFVVVDKPSGSVFVDSGSGVAWFRWLPALIDTGENELIVLCLDDGTPTLSDIDTFTITVVLTNRQPVLDPIGTQVVNEGETLEFLISASDPDGTIPFFLAEDMPLNSILFDSANGTAVFTLAPDFFQAGLYSVRFIASDGTKSDDEIVLIQIVNVPQAPILTVPPDTQFVIENESLVFQISADDADSTIPELLVDSLTLPENAGFTDFGDGSGEFTFDPTFIQSGIYDVVFIATDGEKADTAVVVVNCIEAGNQPPIFTSIPDSIEVTEGDLIDFNVYTYDPEGVTPLLSVSTLPSGASFQDYENGIGNFIWQTINLQVGLYEIIFYANDGFDPGVVTEDTVMINVLDLNIRPRKPYFDPPTVCLTGFGCTAELDEGDTIQFKFYSGDADETHPRMEARGYNVILSEIVYDTVIFEPPYEVDTTYVYDTLWLPLPDHMSYNDLGNDTADFIFAPDYLQAGVYPILLLAFDEADSNLFDATDFTFTVYNVPVPVILDPVGDMSLTEGDTLDRLITAYDPDGGSVQIYAEGLPTGATFTVQSLNPGISQLYYIPSYTDAGSYPVLFYAVDAGGTADSESIILTVIEAGPQKPIISGVPDSETLKAGDTALYWIQSYDPDGSTPALAIEGDPYVPWNAVFADSLNGNASFLFAPDSIQADSTFIVSFIASDGALADTQSVEIRIINFVRGDADGNGIIEITDAAFLIAYIFVPGAPAPDPLEAGNVDGVNGIEITDAAYLIDYIFGGGPPPPP